MNDSTAPLGVLFVCHANICRSPLAGALFIHRAAQRGVADRFFVDSAGTWGMDGASPHALSMDVARRNEIGMAPFQRVARGLAPNDIERFAHIIAMDRRNVADLQRLSRMSAFGRAEQPSGRVRLLQQLVDPSRTGSASDVADPVRGGPADFDRAFAEIDAGCVALLDELVGPPR